MSLRSMPSPAQTNSIPTNPPSPEPSPEDCLRTIHIAAYGKIKCGLETCWPLKPASG